MDRDGRKKSPLGALILGVIARPAAATAPGNFVKMPVLRPRPKTQSETRGVRPATSCLNKLILMLRGLRIPVLLCKDIDIWRFFCEGA